MLSAVKPNFTVKPKSHRLASILLGGILAMTLAGCQTGDSEPTGSLERWRAINALDEQRFDLARQYLAAARGSASDSVNAEWLRLEAEAWSSGTLQSASKALASWRAYLALRPGDDDARLQAARALFTLGEWQSAADFAAGLESSLAVVLRLRALAELDPRLALAELPQPVADDAPLQATAARIYRAIGDQAAALEHARRAVELDPLDRQSRYLLARLHQARGERADAGEQLEMQQLLSRFEGVGSVDLPSSLDRLQLLATISSRLARLPWSWRLEQPRLLVEAGRLAAAAQELESFAEAPRGLEMAMLLELAGLARRAGRASLARGFLEAALARAGEVDGTGPVGRSGWREATYGLAFLDHESGDQGAARERLEALIAAAPHCARAHHLLGRLQLTDADESVAEASFARALRLAPWKAGCRIDLANLLLSRGRLDEALELVAAAPEADPELERFARRHG